MFITPPTDAAFYMCPDRLRLPLIFYYAHTATLYVNKMLASGMLTERVNRDFEALFETGVDEMSWDDTENYRMGGTFEWPSLKDVYEYRKSVRDIVTSLIASYPLELPVTQESPMWSLFLGMEHERIHIETSSVLIRQLPMAFITKQPAVWKNAPITSKTPVPTGDSMVTLGGDGIKAHLGKPKDFPSFGWDNEYGEAAIVVPKFEVSKYLTTNAEFLKFVRAGGYSNESLWTSEGWKWVEFREVQHPVFWVCDRGCKNGCGDKGGLSHMSHCKLENSGECGEGPPEKRARAGKFYEDFDFKLRTIYEVIDLPGDWPAEINYHEAKAFCHWKGDGFRLPTEAEMALMRTPPAPGTENTVASDIVYQDNFQANINLKYGSASPVNLFPPSTAGVCDAQGNVWQWVEDHFNGLPGFKSHYLYDDFSSPCFDGRHTMILGGSFIATGDEASRFARFAFRRHFIQHAGFRVVRSVNSTPVRLTCMPGSEPEVGAIPRVCEKNVTQTTNNQLWTESDDYREDRLRQEYLDADTAAYPDALVETVSPVFTETSASARVLVVGAGTGKVPLLLSAKDDQKRTIVAQDYCGVLTDAGEKLGKEGQFKLQDGTIVVAPKGAKTDRIQFMQLTWLPVEIGLFDLVVVDLFLERALNSKAWLVRFIGDILNANGTLVIVCSEEKLDEVNTLLSSRSLKCFKTSVIEKAPCEGPATVSFWKQ